MRKEKCVVLVCKKIQKNIIDYYNSFANHKYDIIVVAPSINQELNKNYTTIHFYTVDFFLEPNNYIKNTHRPNWHYQQFLKYSIVLKLNFDIVHIIDGDSVLSSNYFFTKNFYFSEFKLNVKEVIKNSDELSGLEKIAARAFSGVIEKTLDEINILFDFKENKTTEIIVTRKEETESRVVFNWKIDEDDKLRLDEIYDQNQVRLGDTAYWVLDEGKLIPYNNEGNINEGILLIKVK